DGAPEQADALANARFVAGLPELIATQVELPGLGISRACALRHSRTRRKFQLECSRNLFGNLPLDFQGVRHLAIVRLRPQVRIRTNLDELHSHANAITRLAHAALDDVIDVELSRDLRQ